MIRGLVAPASPAFAWAMASSSGVKWMDENVLCSLELSISSSEWACAGARSLPVTALEGPLSLPSAY